MASLGMGRRASTSLVGLVLVVALAATGTPALQAASPTRTFVISGEGAAAAVRSVGGLVERPLDVVGGVAARLGEAAARQLESSGFGVAPDQNVPVLGAGWETGPASIQVGAMRPGPAWDATAGTGVTVALVDTGVIDTPDLDGRLRRGPDLSGDGDGIDHYGHGTFMAGLIAGGRTGIAPGADVLSVKVAGRDGITSLVDVLAGIGWVIDNAEAEGVGVMSLSFGFEPPYGWRADPLSAAVEEAWAHGITVVAAIGNGGTGAATSPGRDPWVIGVGAVDTLGTSETADDRVASFSGSSTTRWAQKPDVLAPGVSVVSIRVPGSTVDTTHPSGRTDDGLFRGSGTSMSTALTAGAAAVLLTSRPEATPDDVKAALRLSAAPVAGSSVGAVDLAAADEVSGDEPVLEGKEGKEDKDEGKDDGKDDGKGVDAPSAWDQELPLADGHAEDARAKLTRMPWSTARWNTVKWNTVKWNTARWNTVKWNTVKWNTARWSTARWSTARWSTARWSTARWSTARWSTARWSTARWSTARWSTARWTGADGSPGSA